MCRIIYNTVYGKCFLFPGLKSIRMLIFFLFFFHTSFIFIALSIPTSIRWIYFLVVYTTSSNIVISSKGKLQQSPYIKLLSAQILPFKVRLIQGKNIEMNLNFHGCCICIAHFYKNSYIWSDGKGGFISIIHSKVKFLSVA